MQKRTQHFQDVKRQGESSHFDISCFTLIYFLVIMRVRLIILILMIILQFENNHLNVETFRETLYFARGMDFTKCLSQLV